MRRRGSDRDICAYLKQPNAMTQGARRTDHLSSPTACSSMMRSSKACTKGGSTTGACPRCPVALGVVGTCKLPSSRSWSAFLFIHFKAWSARAGAAVWFRNWSRSTIPGGAGRPRLSKKVLSSNQVLTTLSMVAFSASFTFFSAILLHVCFHSALRVSVKMPAGLYAPMPTNIETTPFTLFWTASLRFLSTLMALGFFL